MYPLNKVSYSNMSTTMMYHCVVCDVEMDSPRVYCGTTQCLNTAFIDTTPDEDMEEPIKNLCVECGVDMGPNNPRQYCCKTYCDGIDR